MPPNAAPPPDPTPLGLAPSFGFGDRLGLATPGHIEALRRHGGGIAGIFAQQSIREMTRTQRSAHQVMADAAGALAEAGWQAAWGADADHLKTDADIERMAEAGFTFFTIDPSEAVDQQADGYTAEEVAARYEPTAWVPRYLGREERFAGERVVFDEPTLHRAAVKYGRAIERAKALAETIRASASAGGRAPEIEISVDETEQPTTPAEHYIIADQLLAAGVNLVSLAPRFIGTLEKGVDYIGDVAALERSLEVHAAIAERLGPYKLSLHSGSDKLSMYAAFARATGGRFHVKTAGTSYLEALRVLARQAPGEFRRVIDFSRAHYERDRATYHVHATLEDVPPPSEVAGDRELERHYLECWEDVPVGCGFTAPGRQILHCTFGSVLTDPALGPRLRSVLEAHPQTHRRLLAEHFGRHLQALRAGLEEVARDPEDA